MPKTVNSRLTGVFTEKGPLIAGFRELLSSFSEIDPFDDNARIQSSRVDPGHPTGSKRVQTGSKRAQKEPNTVHLRPNVPWEP